MFEAGNRSVNPGMTKFFTIEGIAVKQSFDQSPQLGTLVRFDLVSILELQFVHGYERVSSAMALGLSAGFGGAPGPGL